MEFSALSNLQIFIIIVVVLSLIIFLLVSNRSKNIPTDAEAFNNALKALVNGEKDKAFHLLREIISKDSNNTQKPQPIKREGFWWVQPLVCTTLMLKEL